MKIALLLIALNAMREAAIVFWVVFLSWRYFLPLAAKILLRVIALMGLSMRWKPSSTVMY